MMLWFTMSLPSVRSVYSVKNYQHLYDTRQQG